MRNVAAQAKLTRAVFVPTGDLGCLTRTKVSYSEIRIKSLTMPLERTENNHRPAPRKSICSCKADRGSDRTNGQGARRRCGTLGHIQNCHEKLEPANFEPIVKNGHPTGPQVRSVPQAEVGVVDSRHSKAGLFPTPTGTELYRRTLVRAQSEEPVMSRLAIAFVLSLAATAANAQETRSEQSQTPFASSNGTRPFLFDGRMKGDGVRQGAHAYDHHPSPGAIVMPPKASQPERER